MNAPGARTNHTALWTGTQMLIHGGQWGTNTFHDTIAYDPVGDAWTPLAVSCSGREVYLYLRP